ncbi:MAG: endonuclease III [Candidatus Bathyarchaeota archaeon]|nr:endonuclease III [Candidatus Bathyarchaeota archaeon]
MTQTCAASILNTLKDTLGLPRLVKVGEDPFQMLVVTIISQNTADINTERAFKNLSQHFEITPKVLSEASLAEIEQCIRVGGLYKNKAQTIQAVSKIIQEKYRGNLKPVLSLPLNEARRTLMEMPGVGPKTADVVLLFSANQPTIPVDTHVNRVSKRLGLTPKDGDYENVRLSLQKQFEPKNFLAVHLLLIALGRKYCKAHNQRCVECTVNAYCPSKSTGDAPC